MPLQPTIITTDLEGVLVPEIWIAVAERTGIDALRLTTRDLPDYDQLMQGRLRILRDNQLSLADIQAVIATLQPLPGAPAFLDWLREQVPCTIVSDTFYEFAAPLMVQLGYPTLLCHQLEIDGQDRVIGYRLRQPNSKRRVVEAFQGLGFRVIAIGDSYNDTAMLTTADSGILFRAPEAVCQAFPQLPVVYDYSALQAAIAAYLLS
ncbi:MAG: bifunctional phosphoserine phosphatase/homoserine phosphotransferase ThrH [Herpetosiphonaceae bacterium]|nr:bifunctional phosphoserine phosphatase/homoserine phosphotransferase ThrH [Herpetosiphonaceae bacterium]